MRHADPGPAIAGFSELYAIPGKLRVGPLKKHLVKMFDPAKRIRLVSAVQVNIGESSGRLDIGNGGVAPDDAMEGRMSLPNHFEAKPVEPVGNYRRAKRVSDRQTPADNDPVGRAQHVAAASLGLTVPANVNQAAVHRSFVI